MEFVIAGGPSHLPDTGLSHRQYQTTVGNNILNAVVLNSEKLSEWDEPSKNFHPFSPMNKAPFMGGRLERYAATLLIGDMEFEVTSDVKLERGEHLLLRANEEGHLLVSSPTRDEPYKTLREALIAQGLRTSLPNQGSLQALAPLLAQIIQYQSSATEQTPLLENIRNQAQQLFASVSRVDDLTHVAALKQAVENSGILMEHKLALLAAQQSGQAGLVLPHQANLNTDLKVQLSRLESMLQVFSPETQSIKLEHAQSLNPEHQLTYSPKPQPNSVSKKRRPASDLQNQQVSSMTFLAGLSKAVESALAHIQVNQLTSLKNQYQASGELDGGLLHWFLDLPVLNREQSLEVINLRIQEQHEEENNGRLTQCWTVSVNFDFQAQGKVQIELQLKNDSIQTTVWSESRETYEQIKSSIDDLQNGLESTGTLVSNIRCLYGISPSEGPQLKHPLVDIRT